MTLPDYYVKAHRAYQYRYHGNVAQTTKALQDARTRMLKEQIDD